MFEKLANYIEQTPVTNLVRKYHNGEDNITIQFSRCARAKEADALNPYV